MGYNAAMLTSRTVCWPHNPGRAAEIKALMTPLWYLRMNRPMPARMILPDAAQSFSDLLNGRDKIRMLTWLPIKTEQDRRAFKELDQQALLRGLHERLDGANMLMVANDYPYLLPPDTLQLIVWVRNRDTSHLEVAKFIERVCSKTLHASPSELIMFERPYGSKQPLVKGTFPAMRHVHLWLPR